ncbi:hypothetical protein K8Q96_01955 [Candidatus Nomurabacteria bacterium]|nr:hypothetical protein [Candidatus Nomurabacteria bacterium]
MARGRNNTRGTTPQGGDHATPATNAPAGHGNDHGTHTTAVPNNEPMSLQSIVWIVGSILIVVLGIYLFAGNGSPKQESVVIGQAERPTVYTESYVLKKDTETRINIPIYYSAEYSTGNKQYYRKAQNYPQWELAGGDIPYYTQSTSAAYVDFKAYDEEMTIVITFTRVN